jgi:hypothetical protein
MEMDVLERLKKKLPAQLVLFHEFFHGFSHETLYLGPHVFKEQIGELGFQGRGVGPLSEKDICLEILAHPDIGLAFVKRNHGNENIEVKMGIAGDFFENPRDYIVRAVVEAERFADRLLVSKIFLGGVLAQNQRVRIVQGRIGIPFEKGDAENIEKGRIHIGDAHFPVSIVFVPEDVSSALPEPDCVFHLRVFVQESLGQRRRGRSDIEAPPSVKKRCRHTVDTVGLFVERIVAQLIVDEHQDEKTGGHPDGQTRDIDQGISLAF